MNDKELIQALHDRPGVFGLNGYYYPTTMLLQGFDLARSGGLLYGFREWLIVRRNECSSLQWHLLVIQEALPGVDVGGWKEPDHFTPNENRQIVDRLFSLILEFLEIRKDERKLGRVYAQYEAIYKKALG
ncbi:hypothetical protein [Streptomyces acidiscabies]|uniref:Uncharacterized protein n=1 Tax=Streptomyces acidiscabies TaxID=42234 RepID=A0AAP6BKH3_9ACTN|nr:hypothetical protein [Streptomyces acidiscabies]MBZ3909848.1 hypothetical protein [Streptomyces acidiscabies]MDX2966383.1 hypothetical protein [Streptomyces acidiscabies]MDX3796366.1 hypothetical protein [Streptomyces acidiscabies]GAV41937.1 hypothetical protein Saa2_04853 [Streptomyces acidiscabies]